MYKTIQGIVLKRTRFAESSAYVTVITENGIEKFSAKGILSPKNKNRSATSLFALSEFVLTQKGDVSTLSSATLIKSLIRPGIDFEALAVANYIACLAHDTDFTEEDAPAIYKLLGTALSVLDKKDVLPATVKAVFELRLMAELGFFPDIEFCAKCHKPFSEGAFLSFEGSVLCPACEVFYEGKKVTLTPALTRALATLFSLSNAQAFGIRFANSEQQNAFFTLAEEFSVSHLDCALTALTYYKKTLQVYNEHS